MIGFIGNETIVYKCDHNVDCQTRFPWDLGRQDARNTMPLSNVFPSSSTFERHFYQELADTDEVATKTQPNSITVFHPSEIGRNANYNVRLLILDT